jgi:hypothetical protein
LKDLGIESVYSDKRVPKPPAKITTFIFKFFDSENSKRIIFQKLL